MTLALHHTTHDPPAQTYSSMIHRGQASAAAKKNDDEESTPDELSALILKQTEPSLEDSATKKHGTARQRVTAIEGLRTVLTCAVLIQHYFQNMREVSGLASQTEPIIALPHDFPCAVRCAALCRLRPHRYFVSHLQPVQPAIPATFSMEMDL